MPFANGLRQRKKDQLRAQLIDSAMRRFIERGFADTTIEDIVADLDVSPRTFFRYFETKEDVVVAGPFHLPNQLREYAEAAAPDLSALEVARQAVRRVAAQRQADPDGLRHGALTVETPELMARLARERERWARELAATIAPRVTGDDAVLHARLIATYAIAALGAAYERWIAERGARPLPDVLEAAFRLADGMSARSSVSATPG